LHSHLYDRAPERGPGHLAQVQSYSRQGFATLGFIARHPLCRGRLMSAFGRYFRWQVESRIRSEIEFEWIEGAKLLAKRGMTGATGNIYCGLHEFVEMGFLLHLLRPNDLFLDIGANIGSYTILASKVCGARAVAFEPDPETARALRRNIAMNHLDALAIVREIALGGHTGDVAFTIGLDAMNRVAGADDKSVRMVPVRRLDDIPDAAAPTLIKLDVEGFEEQVLAGASGVLASPSLLALQSELCSPVVQETLKSFGFEAVFYDPFRRAASSTPFGYTSNSLFIRNFEAVKRRLVQAPSRTVVGRSL
jgi:FkbM family methyltransferase